MSFPNLIYLIHPLVYWQSSPYPSCGTIHVSLLKSQSLHTSFLSLSCTSEQISPGLVLVFLHLVVSSYSFYVQTIPFPQSPPILICDPSYLDTWCVLGPLVLIWGLSIFRLLFSCFCSLRMFLAGSLLVLLGILPSHLSQKILVCFFLLLYHLYLLILSVPHLP